MKKFIIIGVVLFVLANIVGWLTKPPDEKGAGPSPESGVSTPPRTRAAP